MFVLLRNIKQNSTTLFLSNVVVIFCHRYPQAKRKYYHENTMIGDQGNLFTSLTKISVICAPLTEFLPPPDDSHSYYASRECFPRAYFYEHVSRILKSFRSSNGKWPRSCQSKFVRPLTHEDINLFREFFQRKLMGGAEKWLYFHSSHIQWECKILEVILSHKTDGKLLVW